MCMGPKQKIAALYLCIPLLLGVPTMTYANCFLVVENNRIIESKGDCDSRHSPCSTFKIAISLMAYDAGLLSDENHPKLLFKEGYADFIDKWKQPHTPRLWMQNSCVWYSQILTKKLGSNKFKDYLKKFNYGNQDVSGDKGRGNGLTNSWLSSSLEVSPVEQTIFLRKLLDNKLPVSVKSQEMTRNLLFIEDLPGGWKLYGKTGSGSLLTQDRTQKTDRQIGWFIGWVQKNQCSIIFAHYIEDETHQDTYASIRAKAAARETIIQIINDRD